MTERSDVIVYGSLMAPDAIESVFNVPRGDCHTVMVSGYRRIVNQQASWRSTVEKKQAVMNVEPAEEIFNAILVPSVDRAAYDAYQKRESVGREDGYDIVTVDTEQVHEYSSNDPVACNGELRIAVGKNPADGIEPAPGYIKECRNGASAWGDAFYATFLETTWLTDNRRLTEAI